MEKELILEATHLCQTFHMNEHSRVDAVRDVSLAIHRGEVLGLVGESGCGKSTIARLVTGIEQPAAGSVLFEGLPVSGPHADAVQKKKLHQKVQLIFQDSAAALNPRMTVQKILLEPVHIQKFKAEKKAALQKAIHMLAEVGLNETYLSKYPGELSGGQRQRVAIARSLMLDPELIVADEPISSLDISIQAQIMMLFLHLRQERKFSMLFIAHDLSAVRFISDRVAVMLQGKVVELAPTEELFQNPLHPYTRSLLSSIHVPDPVFERNKRSIPYDRTLPLGDTLHEKQPGHFVLEPLH